MDPKTSGDKAKRDLNAQMITNQFDADKLIELIDKIGLDTYE